MWHGLAKEVTAIEVAMSNERSVPEREITKWGELATLAEGLDIGKFTQIPFAYRGQACADWGLEPTLVRKLPPGISEEQALAIENTALEEFRSQAHLYLDANTLSSTTNLVGWWTLMQHHGAPTRLLDWCGSIYVAAYFAVITHEEKSGAVWLVHTDTLTTLMKENFDETELPRLPGGSRDQFLQIGGPDTLTFIKRQIKTPRMVAQQGFFSISRNLLADHGEILRDTMRTQPSGAFCRIVIPAHLKTQFLRRLRAMNITASSLFPGLDGLARSIGELIQANAGPD